MRRFALTACLLLAAMLAPLQAQDGPNAAIEGVIRSQIDAFLQDDFATAFTYASPGIRRYFGSSQRFGVMVQQGYPMVWRPANVEFLDLREIDGRLWQMVMIEDADGQLHMLGYQMLQTDEAWKIDGVQILRAPQLGA